MREIFQYYPSQIRKWLTGEGDLWQPEEKTTGITQSSLEVLPGDIFVALRGERDGHDFIPDALQRGAALLIVEKNHPCLSSLDNFARAKCIEVSDTLAALGTLARCHRERFSPLVIAVTGSNGKTTTKEILGTIAAIVGEKRTVVTAKNFNNEIGVPFTLFRFNDDTRLAVIEMGMNHKGEIARLSKMARPTIAVITNIGEAHIEFLGSIHNIACAKAEIVKGMRGGCLYLPEDCRKGTLIRRLAKKQGVPVRKVSWQKKESAIKIKKILPQGFALEIFSLPFHWPLPGKALLSNLTLAVQVLYDIGFAPHSIVDSLAHFRSQEQRLHIIDGYFSVIDDSYNANPSSTRSSIDAALQLADGRPCIAILGDFKELGKHSHKLHRQIGKFCAASELKYIYTFGTEAAEISRAFTQKRKLKTIPHYPDTSEGLTNLIADIQQAHAAGSVILVKGSRSMKMERIVAALAQLTR